MASEIDDPLRFSWMRRQQGRRVALATVIETWESSPCPVGSQLAVDDLGAFAGSVSGGCVEAAVIDEARAVIVCGQARVRTFGVTDHQAWAVGLACGGRLSVYLEPVE